ncbi:hypothetical protein CGCVW01_v006944 [Colletotrichum viniferum]|nr:hypothetical protein CGCVW01_v006944 [Colletotrichum viniferum]
MWTACKESRMIVIRQMTRRYKDLRWGINRAVAHIRHGQENMTFGILPGQDLICIQLPDMEALCPYEDDPLSYLDIQRLGWYGGSVAIAFEYDESWAFDPEKDHIGTMMDEPGPRGAFLILLDRVISEEYFRAKLYLVQYDDKSGNEDDNVKDDREH